MTGLGPSIQRASGATLAGLLPHYACFYAGLSPLWTEAIGEWIMARTPNTIAIPLLERLGAWAKPFAMTGGLAALGAAVWVCLLAGLLARGRERWAACGVAAVGAAVFFGVLFDYPSWVGQLSFWLPAWAVLVGQRGSVPKPALDRGRRGVLLTGAKAALPVVMSSGTALVALESYWRDGVRARRAVRPVPLYPFTPPVERFAPGLVRLAVTPVEPKDEFYRMSKAAVDPAVDVETYRLRITLDGEVMRELTYRELLSLPRVERYVTLRCVSNSLTSDWMDTASWSGLLLRQLVDPNRLPAGLREVVMTGADGYGDSVPLDYAFSDEVLLALGMNGKTLNRAHGAPLRALTPRYYGFRSIKWITEIRLTRTPFFGYWQKLGFTKEPIIQTASHIDGMRVTADGLRVGGASFAGTRGIQAVRLRANGGPWVEAELEAPLSAHTLTRWRGLLPGVTAGVVEARAQDGQGRWQEAVEGPLFPTGVTGPTRRRV